MVVLRTFWAAMVTLSPGQWVTLHPEEKLLKVLTLHSPGGLGGLLVRTLGIGAQVVALTLV